MAAHIGAPHRRITLVLAALMALPSAATAAASPSASPSQPSTAAPSADTGPVVRLLDPGAEPRTALRYRFEAGATAAMTRGMDMTMSAESDTISLPPYALPTIRTVIETTTGEVATDGSARFDFRYLAAGPLEPVDDPAPAGGWSSGTRARGS